MKISFFPMAICCLLLAGSCSNTAGSSDETRQADPQDKPHSASVDTSRRGEPLDAKKIIAHQKELYLSLDQKERTLFIINGKMAAEKEVEQLDPDKIVSCSLMKGAAAVTVYGEKGKNGVVIVEL